MKEIKKEKIIILIGIILIAFWIFKVYSGISDNNANEISDTPEVVNLVEPVPFVGTANQSENTNRSEKTDQSENVNQPETETQTETTNQATETRYFFRNKKLLNSHYEKHGIEMGFKSAEEYEKAASDVINNPVALTKTEKEDGDYIFYIEATNEFVVLATDGYIRTYFKPDSGIKYYNKQ